MKIVVLAGGISTERDVSLITGKMIYKALKEKGHEAILLDVYLGYEADKAELDNIFSIDKDWAENIGKISEDDPDIEAIKALRPDGDKNFFGPNVITLCQNADVVFMALHGQNGENGKIQACFDLMGIKYTGTDYISSAMAMDKDITKDIFRANGIPTPPGIKMTIEEYKSGKTDPGMPLPLVVKTSRGGSSIGVAIARTPEEYVAALKDAFSYDTETIIEKYIKGREFSIGVIGGHAMPIIEIAPISGFYDYKNKYQAGATVDTCPAELPEDITDAMKKSAEDAFKALRLKNYARFDFMMDGETNEFFCLEGNTLPGMTPTSLVPQEAAAEGISFIELCEKIIALALD
ncbi:MAG: D-alanine--D-alanine ligase [Lachnospiraceae bacterium]|nr:D-alanine--D-alanine ligase [Lachnospiraceae bacterium]